jgi:hypothetical protein
MFNLQPLPLSVSVVDIFHPNRPRMARMIPFSFLPFEKTNQRNWQP